MASRNKGFCDETNLRRLDDFLREKINGHRSVKIRNELLKCLRPSELLHHMPCVYVGTKEKIKCIETIDGPRAATAKFLDLVPAHSGWGIEFLDALCLTGFPDLAKKLKPGYTPPPENTRDQIGYGDDGGYGNDHNVNSATQPRHNVFNVAKENLPHGLHPVSSQALSAPPSYEEAVRNPVDFSISGNSLAGIDQRHKLEAYQSRVDHDQIEEYNACRRKHLSWCTNSLSSSAATSNSEEPIAQSSQISSDFSGDSSDLSDRNQQNSTKLFYEESQSATDSSNESTSTADTLDLAYRDVANSSTMLHNSSNRKHYFASSLHTDVAQNNRLDKPGSSKSTQNIATDEFFCSVDSSRFPSIFHRKELETCVETELGDKDVKLSCDPGKVALECTNNVGCESDFDQGVAMLSNSSSSNKNDVQVTIVNDLIDLNFDAQPASPQVNNVHGNGDISDISTLLKPMVLSSKDVTDAKAFRSAGDTETMHTNGNNNLLD